LRPASPLVAVLFDVFGIASTITIRKVGIFSEDMTNLRYSTNGAPSHRITSYLWGNFLAHATPTTVAFLVPPALLWKEQTKGLSFYLSSDPRWIPFGGPFLVWVAFRLLECRAKEKLKKYTHRPDSPERPTED
jgi:hypothetical protein